MSTPTAQRVEPTGLGPVKTPIWAIALKWLAIAAAVALAFYVATKLADDGHWFAVSLVAMVAIAVLAVYGTRRAVPMKYLLPGMLLCLGLQVWPIAYTVMTSFTNYGDGHLISKQDATEQNIAYSVREVQGAPRYQLSVAVKAGDPVATGEPHYLLTAPDKKTYDGTASGLEPLDPNGLVRNGIGRITQAPGFTVLMPRQVNARQDLRSFAVPTDDGGGIKAVGLSEAFEGKPTLTWDKGAGTLTDTATKKVYVAQDARWVPRDGQGEALPVGWKENVGLDNLKEVTTNSTIRDGFVKIFAWNLVFAFLSVATTFVLGMLIALLFNDSRMRGRGIYRSLIILPYAIPSFVTALLWASMFNQDFGLVNDLTGLHVDWLGNPWAAKAAILITNLWLGFPYFFIVCTGALQSIPHDVLEAAKVDGASPWRTIRSIISPLLMVAVGPLLIASFAFNFNNFGLIYLMTKGGPFVEGDASIGSTDLLITYAFRLAFSGNNPNYGLASMVSIFIFVIVALISVPAFRRTKALEEVN
ncbi:ABC transporter permease subunit [Luteipulveratus halotolerans]|uniref:Maltose/maltodextrin transport system permease protein n=1 Tax=Luteipulveratus halotolerans TaxID=1631356 RepID=A0A0L6CKN9_9MICO|nr:ABC transporter permease subunit [Luteipulveratus halotolerans]KNX38195.1 sugar ABC transporter permease [Luteipulveratus halotolerans]